MHWLLKRPLPLHAFDDGDLALDVAYRHWLGCRSGGLLPARADLDTPGFRLVLADLHWLDVAADTNEEAWPLGRLAVFAEAEPVPEETGCKAKRARQSLGELLRQDVRAVRFTGSPLYQELVVRGTTGMVETFHQLLLPFADDGRRVGEILMGVCLRQPAAVAVS